jgi:uncharacterized RDD family membrane protein YckC
MNDSGYSFSKPETDRNLQKAPLINTSFHFAGFWKRFLAALLDIMILYILENAFQVDPVSLLQNYATINIFWILGLWYIISFPIKWLYYAIFESSRFQATPGKLALRLRVVDYRGAKISFGKASLRVFIKFFSGIIVCAGYIMVAFTKRKQGLHDLIAKVLVITRPKISA